MLWQLKLSPCCLAFLMFGVLVLAYPSSGVAQGKSDHLHGIETLLRFYRGNQAWAKEKATSHLVRHGAEAIPVAVELIREPGSDDDIHHGLLMLQYFARDPDVALRKLAVQELYELEMVVAEKIAGRILAILALEPVADKGMSYPRGLPAGLGEPGIDIAMNYFGYEKNSGAFYRGKVESVDGKITLGFSFEGPKFGDAPNRIDVVDNLANDKRIIEISGNVSTGNEHLGGIIEVVFSLEGTELEELRKNHLIEFQAYQRVFAAMKQGYGASSADIMVPQITR